MFNLLRVLLWHVVEHGQLKQSSLHLPRPGAPQTIKNLVFPSKKLGFMKTCVFHGLVRAPGLRWCLHLPRITVRTDRCRSIEATCCDRTNETPRPRTSPTPGPRSDSEDGFLEESSCGRGEEKTAGTVGRSDGEHVHEMWGRARFRSFFLQLSQLGQIPVSSNSTTPAVCQFLPNSG